MPHPLEILQNGAHHGLRHVLAQAHDGSSALIEILLRVGRNLVALAHFHVGPRKQRLAAGPLGEGDLQGDYHLYAGGAAARLIEQGGKIAEADHAAAQHGIRLGGIVDQLVFRVRDQLARDIGRQQARQLIAGAVLRRESARARNVVPAAGQSRHHRQPCRREPGHGSCRATSAAFSAASRKLSATSQNQQASGLLRSTETAPTAIPPWPAWPTLVGGSNSPVRTSMGPTAKLASRASMPGLPSNSTHAEIL